MDHKIKPRSPYGASKAASRHLIKVYRESYGLFAIQGWLFNHEGVRRGEEFVTRKITKGVARIYKEIHNINRWKYHNEDPIKVEPIILGNLDTYRDWSDAEDFVHGVWLMLNSPEPKEYVLASGETHSIREFVEKAFKQLHLACVWENPTGDPEDEGYDPMEEKYMYLRHVHNEKHRTPLVTVSPLFYRPNEVNLLQGDPSKIIKELKYNRKPSLDKLVYSMLLADLKEHFPHGVPAFKHEYYEDGI